MEKRHVIVGRDPFPYVVIDGLFLNAETEVMRSQWPSPDWAGWHRYDTPLERKTVSTVPHTLLPEACAGLLRDLCRAVPYAMSVGLREPLAGGVGEPDLFLYGSGLGEMRDGDFLTCHLDCDRHPVTGRERSVNAVLFLDDLLPGDGGELCLWPSAVDLNSDGYRAGIHPTVVISPAVGRVVVFATTDVAYHSVNALSCRGKVRRTLSVFFWRQAPDTPGKRPRALFVHSGPNDLVPMLESLRASRATW